MAGELNRIGAIAMRDVRIEGSYRLRYVTRLIEVAFTAVVVYQVSKMIVDSPEMAHYGGSYFDFALIGLGVMTMARLGISTFNQNIVREQTQGTLEVLMATPTRVWVLLTGSFVFPLALASIDLVLYGVAIVWFGQGVSVSGLPWLVPLLVLTLGSFCAFGVMGAALVVLTKRGDPVGAPLIAVTSILSGAIFPVSSFPPVVEALAHALPAYYGITGLREALLAGASASVVLPNVLILLAFDVVLLPLSVILFSRALAAARRTGTLSNF